MEKNNNMVCVLSCIKQQAQMKEQYKQNIQKIKLLSLFLKIKLPKLTEDISFREILHNFKIKALNIYVNTDILNLNNFN